MRNRNVYIHAPLIKFGQKEHMEKLIYEGEVFFNTVKYYRDCENSEIGDTNEGLSFISHLPDGKLWCDGKCLGETRNHVVKQTEHIKNKNLFCVFALENQYVLDRMNDDNELLIDVYNHSGFGTHCVVIMDIPSFTERLLQKIHERNLIVEHQLVYYTDFSSYNGEVTPFMKDIKYKHQCEYRFLVHNTENESIKFSIGSIKDIAHIIPIGSVLKRTFEKIDNGLIMN